MQDDNIKTENTEEVLTEVVEEEMNKIQPIEEENNYESVKVKKLKKKIENLEEKRIERIFDTLGFHEFASYLRSPLKIMMANFFAGVFRGLGIVVGMTVVIGFLVWLLGHIVDFPLIGEYFTDLKDLLESFPTNGLR